MNGVEGSYLDISFTTCKQELLPEGQQCKSQAEIDQALQDYQPFVSFVFGQSFLDFENFEKPVKTFMDFSKLTLDLGVASTTLVSLTLTEASLWDSYVYSHETNKVIFTEILDVGPTQPSEYGDTVGVSFMLSQKGNTIKRQVQTIETFIAELGGLFGAVVGLFSGVVTLYENQSFKID